MKPSPQRPNLSHCTGTPVLPAGVCRHSVHILAVVQVTTPAAEDGNRQAHEVASDQKKSSRHDVLSYEKRRLTRLIYPHPDLHLQVGMRSS